MAESKDVNFDQAQNDKVLSKVEKFLRDGCGCSQGIKGGQCSQRFSLEAVMANVNNCLELSHAELNLVILANIQACTSFEVPGKKQKRSPRCNFLFQSLPVCKDMFLHLYAMSYSRFRRLKEHYGNHGISPRVHGNSKRLPQNMLPQGVVEDVTTFLSN